MTDAKDGVRSAPTSMNLLSEPIIRLRRVDGKLLSCSLPQLLAHLMADEVESLAALRPHQKQALHCFLVQVGALALLAAGEHEPPADPERWAHLLRGLTPDYANDEPWCLVVEDLSKPAFMQPPLPEGTWAALREIERTPDSLDMLVTAKNHDLKAARVANAEPEHWFYSLVTLQTCEGFLGRGNYGISRMNGGFASRPFVGATPSGVGWGGHLRRDILRLLDTRAETLEAYPGFAVRGGIALVWLAPWDGDSSHSLNELDLFYIEICRRIRLRRENGDIVAARGASRVSRVQMPENTTGLTGDPWTPIDRTGPKPLTVDGSGFGYRRVAALLDESKFQRPPLQIIGDGEKSGAMELVFIATVRGQGETQGYHERRIPVPSAAVPFFLRKSSSPRLGELAKMRVEDVSMTANRALRPALFTLFQAAPDELDFKDPKAKTKAEPHIAAFERLVDARFFTFLFDELTAVPEETEVHRRQWVHFLRDCARDVLATAETGSPISHVRRYRARAAAESTLEGAMRRQFSNYFKEAA